MQNTLITIGILVLAYLIGSIPFALIMGKLNGVDLREVGSKNIGSTNAVRVLGKPRGLFAFAFEVFKGAFPVLLVNILVANSLYTVPFVVNELPVLVIYGAPAILGHVFPIYLKFKGGKAVAVSLGLVLALTPIPAILCLIVFMIFVVTTGYVSLGSTGATLTVVISTWILFPENLVLCILYTILGSLIIFKHKKNYVRLLNGTESSFKKKKKKVDESTNDNEKTE